MTFALRRPLAVLAAICVSLSVQAEETPAEPFAFADFTWLNGNSRQKESLIKTPYFTGTFLADINAIHDFNRPKDHTLAGSTSAGRTEEIQVQMLAFGGDFNFQNARARLMTQFGLASTMTPRNDASPARGQWDLGNASRNLSEAYAGYHWDQWHGINLDVGMFMAMGLFSYYSFENWTYQASYTAAATPTYFNGARLQVFPSDRLKLELWLINGWQSYGMFNDSPGAGFQILSRPTGEFSFVTNAYAGTDTALLTRRKRYHSDTSVQYKYYDRPDSDGISKAAFSLTFDIGCEEGDGVRCTGGNADVPSQYVLGVMAYNRLWFKRDTMAVTLGGGFINNPGRYLVLLPPTQLGSTGPGHGASAYDNSCPGCFSTAPGTEFRAWDATLTFDYMPDQFVTFRSEFGHREANVPYFAGPGGVTSPDGWNTTAQPAGWNPDFVKTENRLNFAMLVRF